MLKTEGMLIEMSGFCWFFIQKAHPGVSIRVIATCGRSSFNDDRAIDDTDKQTKFLAKREAT